jgi:virulence-associated protein VagC
MADSETVPTVEAKPYAWGYRFEGQEEVVIYRVGSRVILEPKRRQWSRDFLELAGSAKDFPYPPEPPEAEPVADFDR